MTIQHAHPSSRKLLATLIYTEASMCFVRFSVMSFLALYLIQTRHWTDKQAYALYGMFISLMFALPIGMSHLIDRFLGYKRSILLGGLLLVLGSLMMSLAGLSVAMYVALALMILGSALFQPSLAPILNRLYQADGSTREKGFLMDYLGQNLGAIVGPLVCGAMARHSGFSSAFGLCAVGLFSGLWVFYRNQSFLPDNDAHERPLQWFFWIFGGVASTLMLAFILNQPSLGRALLYVAGGYLLWSVVKLIRTPDPVTHQFGKHLGWVLVVLMVFETLLNQGGLTFSLFIERHIHRMWGGMVIPTPMFYALASAFMMFWGLGIMKVWEQLNERGWMPTHAHRLMIGMLGMALALAVFWVAAVIAQHQTRASMGWIVLAYALLPFAELCLVPVTLAWLVEKAPSDRSSLFVSFWMLSKALGGFFAGEIAQWAHVDSAWTAAQSAGAYALLFQQLTLGALCVAVIIMLFSRMGWMKP